MSEAMVSEKVGKTAKILLAELKKDYEAAGVPWKEETEKKVMEVMDILEGELSEELYEDYRSIREIHGIVEAVRLGMKVQIDYAEPDEDSEYVFKACW